MTGKPAYPTGKILEYFGFDRFISTVVCTSDTRAEKEHLIREALPADHGEAWMVGDRCFDIEAARAVGLTAIGADYGYSLPGELAEAGAEAVFDSVDSLAAFLLRGEMRRDCDI